MAATLLKLGIAKRIVVMHTRDMNTYRGDAAIKTTALNSHRYYRLTARAADKAAALAAMTQQANDLAAEFGGEIVSIKVNRVQQVKG